MIAGVHSTAPKQRANALRRKHQERFHEEGKGDTGEGGLFASHHRGFPSGAHILTTPIHPLPSFSTCIAPQEVGSASGDLQARALFSLGQTTPRIQIKTLDLSELKIGRNLLFE